MMPRNVSPIRRTTHVPLDRDDYLPPDIDLYHNIFFGVKYGLILTGMLASAFIVGFLVGGWLL